MRLVNKSKPLGLAIAIGMALVSTSSFASSKYDAKLIEQEINSAYDLLKFQDRMATKGVESQEELISQSLKLKAMSDYAKTIAIRSGIKSRISNIDAAIQANARNLDAIYDFQPLMIQGRVVPPVITEATNLYNQPNNTQINIAKKRFEIVQQARFASTAPNWREYLVFPIESSAYEKFTYVSGDMKPSNELELKVWHEATIEGWEMGVNQANEILRQSLERLNRDYIGMVRFHQFVMQGKLSMPAISQYKIHDTNNGSTMVVDEDLLRITVLPTFNSQKPVFSLPQHQLNSDEVAIIDESSFVETPTEIAPKLDEMLSDAEQGLIQNHPSKTAPKPVQVAKKIQQAQNNVVTDGNKGSYTLNQNDLANSSDFVNKPNYQSIYDSSSTNDTLGIEIKRVVK